MKILVVHRQESILKGIKGILREANHYIRYFKSGLDGLMSVRMEKYDLVICGTDLPVITGYELARCIRLMSNRSQVAIILISEVIDERVAKLGIALQVLGMLMTSELSRSLPGLVGETLLNMKYDIDSSSPHRLN